MDKIATILADAFRVNISEIKPDTVMEDIDTWDSLTHMEMVVALEERLGIEFNGDEIAEMLNIAEIYRIVEKKLNGN